MSQTALGLFWAKTVWVSIGVWYRHLVFTTFDRSEKDFNPLVSSNKVEEATKTPHCLSHRFINIVRTSGVALLRCSVREHSGITSFRCCLFIFNRLLTLNWLALVLGGESHSSPRYNLSVSCTLSAVRAANVHPLLDCPHGKVQKLASLTFSERSLKGKGKKSLKHKCIKNW